MPSEAACRLGGALGGLALGGGHGGVRGAAYGVVGVAGEGGVGGFAD